MEKMNDKQHEIIEQVGIIVSAILLSIGLLKIFEMYEPIILVVIAAIFLAMFIIFGLHRTKNQKSTS